MYNQLVKSSITPLLWWLIKIILTFPCYRDTTINQNAAQNYQMTSSMMTSSEMVTTLVTLVTLVTVTRADLAPDLVPGDTHTLQCNSLPSFDNTDLYLYFGCSCGSVKQGGMFRKAFIKNFQSADNASLINFKCQLNKYKPNVTTKTTCKFII